MLTGSVLLAPPAGALIQSLRNIGYNFNSAVADIVDNSIDAKAKNIQIKIDAGDLSSFAVSIADDGFGMTFDELKEAMSLGSKSPEFERAEGDLGRFGMGLKTASFSQAKILSVVSLKSSGCWSGLRWDLEKVASSNKWEAAVLTSEQIQQVMASSNIDGSISSGTIVRWDQCDRLVPPGSNGKVLSDIFTDAVIRLTDHLSLVFHKFLSRESLAIAINCDPVIPSNPFCIPRGSKALGSTLHFSEAVSGSDSGSDQNQKPIEVNGYLIPHPTRFISRETLNEVAPHGDFLSSQGVYIYRGQRLLSWGDWYRIAPRNQENRLARIEIELPNTLDQVWQLDIKKSRVVLPAQFRNWLKPKVLKLTGHSLHTHKGRTTSPKYGTRQRLGTAI